ncbi:hypothetical protein HERIO_2192 [Hepatospora eriocheir]|uniref:Uncharacterized protein n=1 Tax=Hepatospora eriocheir TaxID=1081669 RepID=A0A1X0Q7X4_9MICR|nr:hypothetical protein HERIO_2192 [Hepatospora eriocheir]
MTKFNFEEFSNLVNKTSVLLNETERNKDQEIRLKGNIKALKYIIKNIDDMKLKEQADNILTSLLENKVCTTEINITQTKKNDEMETLVDENILKDSKSLRKITEEFNQSLKRDRNILDKISENYKENIKESTKNITETTESVYVSTYLFYITVIFIVCYFIIRI